jgi:hypothetical protein
LIGAPVGVAGSGDVVKSGDALKADETPAEGSRAAFAPLSTPNFIAKFDGSGNPTADSIMFDNGAGVGIGTTNPTAKLDVMTSSGTAISGFSSDNTSAGVSGFGAGSGVVGSSTAGFGLQAFSQSGISVYATSTSGIGVYAQTNGSSDAIQGVSTSGDGVQGLSTSSSGVQGVSSSGPGIQASSGSGTALVVASSSGDIFRGTGGGQLRFLVQNDGDVGIGTASPSAKLHVVGDSAPVVVRGVTTNGYAVRGESTGGFGVYGMSESGVGVVGVNTSGIGVQAISTTGDLLRGVGGGVLRFRVDNDGDVFAKSYNTISDARLKTNLQPLTDVLEKLQQVRGVSYERTDVNQSPARREIGVIAQEVEAIFPELVAIVNDEGYKAVAYERLTAVLIEAVKELKAENEALRAELESVKQLVKEK